MTLTKVFRALSRRLWVDIKKEECDGFLVVAYWGETSYLMQKLGIEGWEPCSKKEEKRKRVAKTFPINKVYLGMVYQMTPWCVIQEKV